MPDDTGPSDDVRDGESGGSESVDLSDDAVRVLAAIQSLDGEGTTSDIRPVVDFDVGDPRRKILYIVDEYLEPAGFVESVQPEGTPGNTPPREISLTESGRSYIESNEDSSKTGGETVTRLAALEDRIDALEAENERLREQLGETESGTTGEAAGGVDEGTIADLEQRMDEFDDDLDELDEMILSVIDELKPLQETVDELEQTVGDLDSHPLLRDGAGVEALNRALILGNTLQVLLNGQDLLTADMVEDEYERRAQVLAENNRLLPAE